MGFTPIQKVLAVFISLLAVAVSFRYFVHYWGLLQRDAERASQHLRRYQISSVLLMAASLLFLVALFGLVYDAQTGAEKIVIPFGTRTPDIALTQPEATTPSPIPLQPAAPSPAPELSPTPTLITQLARIGNTNTLGVNVRSAPNLQGEVIANLPDDTQVFLLPESLEADGFLWRHITFFNDLEGWVANDYLIPEQ
jgi:hypothetical protein